MKRRNALSALLVTLIATDGGVVPITIPTEQSIVCCGPSYCAEDAGESRLMAVVTNDNERTIVKLNEPALIWPQITLDFLL